MPLKMDPAKRAHLERVMERRRKEGRSSTSRSVTTEGRLGPVVPATFPPESSGGYGGSQVGGVSPEPQYVSSTPRSGDDQGALDRQREEVMKIREETRRELERQRAISAQSENQLKWQQQQLEQQLSVDDRLRDRASRFDKPPPQDDEVDRRLKERERGFDNPPPPPPSDNAEQVNAVLANKVADLERQLNEMRSQPPVHRTATPDPYDVSVRRAAPSATSTIYDDPNNFMKPGHTANPTRAPPLPPADPIFTKANNSYQQQQQPPPAPWIPSAPLGNHHGNNRANVDPVWDTQAPVVEEQTINVRGRHGEGGGSVRREDRSASPPKYEQHLANYKTQFGGQPQPQSGHYSGMSGGMSQSQIVQQHMPQTANYNQQRAVLNKQLRWESIIHDMKNGAIFIKWTKNDKPHLRWFWFNQKKLLLLWSNTQSASLLMSNNIPLEEVVSIKAEQLTEESPGDPGHPQVYYLMTITTYKRQLQLACQDREKFNRWFEGLTVLTQQYRQANEVAYTQAVNPAMSRVISRQAMQSRAARTSAITAAD